MRQNEKDRILEILKTLSEAHAVIKDYIAKDDFANAHGLLADCQQTAVGIGGIIEDSEGVDCASIRLLEDYCETLYQVSEGISDKISAKQADRMLKKSLVRVERSVKQDIAVRIEAVFLPYKASMWDSLESVWKAADEDPACDAYVIPIPYYDKNPGGSFCQEHYEGDLYPDYVPITRYDEYDFQNRQPDVIFIHNPYDECNYVTSVHPFFYSKNVKRFTKKLVYIPYFILGEISPDNEEIVEGMKHFCFLPGIINADQVIVQSENMRQIYINEYMKAAMASGLLGKHTERRLLEKKFLGTGSPKFDKVLNTKKEDLEIPDKWLKIIKKPDGTWKKIVFYNNSINALLTKNEKMMTKMESVFEIFKESKDEIALLWRPHPLIESTLISIRPQLWEAYKAIRNKYIEEGWGIYDDTVDVDRAIVVSDAYYGDMSSVVQMYELTGKPIMILDAEVQAH